MAMHDEKITNYLHSLLAANADDIRLRKQFKYDCREDIVDPYGYLDVTNDLGIGKMPGLLHRYPTKVLVCPTDKCLGHCRFCFRKHIKEPRVLDNHQVNNIEIYLRENPMINEVILSGGDPLSLSNEELLDIVRRIRLISSIKIIRIHTRALTYNPKLLSKELINALLSFMPIYFVFHINSHLELAQEACDSLKTIIDAGIPCFSQTALLKEVNDSYDDLASLFMTLIENRIKPYYLFHPDRVMGCMHFYVSLSRGIELYSRLFNRISGLAMPMYLLNIPGGYGHTIIDLGNIQKLDGNRYLIHSWERKEAIYDE